jgi:hypothetical protein
MPFFTARLIHFGYLLLLTGLFWLAVRATCRRRFRKSAFTPMGIPLVLLVVLWFFTYPPVDWVLAPGHPH